MKRTGFLSRWFRVSGNDRSGTADRIKGRRARPALLTFEDRNGPSQLVGVEAGFLGAAVQRHWSPTPPAAASPKPTIHTNIQAAEAIPVPASVVVQLPSVSTASPIVPVSSMAARPMDQASAIPPPPQPPSSTTVRAEQAASVNIAVGQGETVSAAPAVAPMQVERATPASSSLNPVSLASVATPRPTSMNAVAVASSASAAASTPLLGVEAYQVSSPGTSAFGPAGTQTQFPRPNFIPDPGRLTADPAAPQVQSPRPNVGQGQLAVYPGTQEIAKPLESGTPLFRIIRSGGGDLGVNVRYTLTAYGAGLPAGGQSLERSAAVPSGAAHTIILAGPELAGRRPEVVTMRAHAGAGHILATPTATRLFLPADGRASDGALFEAFRKDGSQVAFDQLVRQHRPMVQRTCQRILVDRYAAEDAAQSVFLALAGLQVRTPSTLAGWLHKVARNRSIGLLRSRKRREKRESLAARDDGTPPPEPTYMTHEELERAMRMLPPPLREAVTLRYLDGHSQQEAAHIVGCPRGTLSRRAADGIERLRTMLAPS